MVKTIKVEATGQTFVDALLNRTAWGDEGVTFGFTTSVGQYSSVYGQGETAKGYQALSGTQITAAKDAMSAWAELIDLKISESSATTADIRIAMSSAPKTAWAYAPGTSGEAGDVWFGTSAGYYGTPKAGNYAYHTFIHELGHALGLSHPHENKLGTGNYSAEDVTGKSLCPCCAGLVHGTVSAADASINVEAATAAGTTLNFGGSTAGSTIDAMAYSIMSYSSYANDGRDGYSNGTWDYAQSPMLRDIAAVQYLYGANYTTRSGDTVYSWSATSGEKFINGVGQGAPGGNKVFETIWDGGGRDTVDLSKYTSALKIDLAPGGWANFGNSQVANLGDGHSAPGNVAFAYLHQGDERSLIENAVGGSGNDTIKGNAADNVLVGGAGNDRLEGLEGNNILAGGTIGNELSLLGLNKAEWISATLPTITTDGDDILIGGSGNDIFVASGGNDTVQGNAGLNTLVIDTTLAALDIVKQGANLVFTYQGGSIKAMDIDYLALKDGIYAIGGSDAVIVEDANSAMHENISLIYSAGLDREIDPSGLQYWSDMLDHGASLSVLASGIVDSAEFGERFGNPAGIDDAAFVNVLYQNVLDRAGEAAGLAYWVDTLAAGQSRADVLVAISVSDENRANLANEQSPAHGALQVGGIDLVAVTQQQWADVWA